MHHMASTVVYGKKSVPEQDVRPVSERGSNKTGAMKEQIAHRRKKRKEDWKRHKEKKRVVFFGAGTFGRGRRGPCPRKALLRSIGLLAPVVLVHEYNTSKCCCSCGSVLKQIDCSHVIRCPKSQTGENRCPAHTIDRDLNGASNIAVCGARQLYNLHRPDYLRREPDNDPEDYFKF